MMMIGLHKRLRGLACGGRNQTRSTELLPAASDLCKYKSPDKWTLRALCKTQKDTVLLFPDMIPKERLMLKFCKACNPPSVVLHAKRQVSGVCTKVFARRL